MKSRFAKIFEENVHFRLEIHDKHREGGSHAPNLGLEVDMMAIGQGVEHCADPGHSLPVAASGRASGLLALRCADAQDGGSGSGRQARGR
jgi:hypothetical protein